MNIISENQAMTSNISQVVYSCDIMFLKVYTFAIISGENIERKFLFALIYTTTAALVYVFIKAI